MEREKIFLGWRRTLYPEEVQYSREDMILREYLGKWRVKRDGTATLRVAPWNRGSGYTMMMFIEGLGEGGFSTVDVTPVDDVEIVEVLY
jgi:hypothetical protein